jgi:hypothetical protein
LLKLNWGYQLNMILCIKMREHGFCYVAPDIDFVAIKYYASTVG